VKMPGRRTQEGSVTVWFVICALGFFVIAGLVADGGTALAARARAASDAYAAARAGAQNLLSASLASGSAPNVNRISAVSAAQAVLGADNAQGTVAVSKDTVSVSVRANPPTVLLGLIGITHIAVSATSSASARVGA
jgi:hypothetical protein